MLPYLAICGTRDTKRGCITMGEESTFEANVSLTEGKDRDSLGDDKIELPLSENYGGGAKPWPGERRSPR